MDFATVFTFLAALWSYIGPTLAVLKPIAEVFGPVLQFAAPLIDIFGGPLMWAGKWVVLPAYLLWGFYLAVMTLKRARDAGKLKGIAYALGVPIVAVGLILDFYVNVVFGSIVFFDLPKETTFTARLKRYAAQPGTRRFTLTVWFAALLDIFDPDGYHVAATYEQAAQAIDGKSTESAFDAVASLAQRLAGRAA